MTRNRGIWSIELNIEKLLSDENAFYLPHWNPIGLIILMYRTILSEIENTPCQSFLKVDQIFNLDKITIFNT